MSIKIFQSNDGWYWRSREDAGQPFGQVHGPFDTFAQAATDAEKQLEL